MQTIIFEMADFFIFVNQGQGHQVIYLDFIWKGFLFEYACLI